jgi:hypothetical protein
MDQSLLSGSLISPSRASFYIKQLERPRYNGRQDEFNFLDCGFGKDSMPDPMNKGQEKGSGQPAMNRSKQRAVWRWKSL